MANLNCVFLMGNITRDPELKYLPSGTAVTELGLAINRVYTTKEGEKREEVVFIDVTVWNRQAENCCQYLKKGSPVHVEGSIRMDSWDDKTTGEKRTKLKVHAERVQFLGSRRDNGAGAESDDDPSAARRPAPQRSTAGAPSGMSRGPAPSARPPAPAAAPAPDSEGEEDIPF